MVDFPKFGHIFYLSVCDTCILDKSTAANAIRNLLGVVLKWHVCCPMMHFAHFAPAEHTEA